MRRQARLQRIFNGTAGGRTGCWPAQSGIAGSFEDHPYLTGDVIQDPFVLEADWQENMDVSSLTCFFHHKGHHVAQPCRRQREPHVQCEATAAFESCSPTSYNNQ